MHGLHSAAAIATQEKIDTDKHGEENKEKKLENKTSDPILINDDKADEEKRKETTTIKSGNEEESPGLANIKILSTYSLSCGEKNSGNENEIDSSERDKARANSVESSKLENTSKESDDQLSSSFVTSKGKAEFADKAEKNISKGTDPEGLATLNSESDGGAMENTKSINSSVRYKNRNVKNTCSESEGVINTNVPPTKSANKPSMNTSAYFYQCGFDDCRFAANTSNDYKDHLGTQHPFASEYKCAHCGHRSVTEDLHMRHISGHSKSTTSVLFNCGEGCKFGTNLLNSFKDHVEKMHPNLLDYKCASCKDIFKRLDDLIIHLEFNKLQFVLCPHCSFKDKNRRVVMKHLSESHPGKPRQITVTAQLVCQERGINAFSPPSVLPSVELAQSTSKPTTPQPHTEPSTSSSRQPTASSDSPQTPQIDFHPLVNGPVVTRPTDTDIAKEKTPEIDIEALSTSNICESEMEIKANKEISPPRSRMSSPADIPTVRESNSLDTNKNSTEEGQLYIKCSKCSYLATGRSALTRHVLKHSRSPDNNRAFVCSLCGTGLDNLERFSSHMKHHIGVNKVKVYLCFLCSYQTNRKERIMSHGMKKHNSCVADVDYSVRVHKYREVAYGCQDCGYVHRNLENFNKHLQNVHGKRDVNSESENNYIIKGKESNVDKGPSTNEKKFACHVCQRSFHKLPQLKQHFSIHLFEEGDHYILYKCSYCAFLSSAKNFVSSHIQEKHPNLAINVKIKKEYINPRDGTEETLSTESSSIQNLHCDCCSFSCSDIKELVQHTKVHLAPQEVNRTENIPEKPVKKPYTGPMKKFIIPSGNIFKEFVQCSECPFKTKRRLDLLRHVKGHPNLEPVSQVSPMKNANPQEKSTRNLLKIQFGKRKISDSAYPETVKRGRFTGNVSDSSEEEEEEWEPPLSPVSKKKQVAVKSTSGSNVKSKKAPSLYYLGGDVLHLKLRPCYAKDSDEPMFECLFCKDVFEEKYSLHRHILQHMDVSFYKCAYCDHGELETSSFVSHIQVEHKKPVNYDQIDQLVIESKINKAIHNMKAQEYWGAPEIAEKESNREKAANSDKIKVKIEPCEESEMQDQTMLNEGDSNASSPEGNVKKEVVDKEDSYDETTRSERSEKSPIRDGSGLSSNRRTGRLGPLPEIIVMMGSFYKCIMCGHRTANRTSVLHHAITHSTRKRQMCPLCSYRCHWKAECRKHIFSTHGVSKEPVFDYEDLDADAQYLIYVDELKKRAKTGQTPDNLHVKTKEVTPEPKKEKVVPKNATVVKRNACPYCEYRSNWTGDVKKHVKGIDHGPA